MTRVRVLQRLGRALAAPAIAIAAGWLVAYATGQDASEAFRQLLTGAIGDVPEAFQRWVHQGGIPLPNELLRSLAKATPLILSGLAVAIAMRTGLFNIGAEGQLMVGALTAAWVGYSCTWLQGPLHAVAALAAGAIAGALWASIAGVLKAYRGAHEVIVTIMLNYVAILWTHWLVTGPMRDPSSMAPATPVVQPAARLWAVEGGANFSVGFLIALVAAPLMAFFLNRTALGYEMRAVGLNPRAARLAAISVPRAIILAMAISGSLAGLAGAVEVLGVHRRFLDAFSPGYGFDSIAVALLGNLQPGGVVLAGLLFGGLSSGAVHMEAYTGTPRQIAGIIQALIIVGVGVRALKAMREARRR